MLKGIPSIISPELLKVLMEMGHSDEIVISDGNFPAASFAKRLIRLDGLGVPDILDAILKLMPLDTMVEEPVAIMEVPKDFPTPLVWNKYEQIIKNYEGNVKMQKMERFSFYDRTKNAYAIIATGETAVYANIILKKGVVKD